MPRMPQIRIENSDGGFRFYIYPSNNNSIPMGRSTQVYQGYNECNKASDLFKSLVLKNGLNAEDGRFVKIETGQIKAQAGDGYITTYHFLYFDETGACVFEGRSRYWSKQNCKKGIQSVFATINKA